MKYFFILVGFFSLMACSKPEPVPTKQEYISATVSCNKRLERFKQGVGPRDMKCERQHIIYGFKSFDEVEQLKRNK